MYELQAPVSSKALQVIPFTLTTTTEQMASLSGVVRSFCHVVGLLDFVLVAGDCWFIVSMHNDA